MGWCFVGLVFSFEFYCWVWVGEWEEVDKIVWWMIVNYYVDWNEVFKVLIMCLLIGDFWLVNFYL